MYGADALFLMLDQLWFSIRMMNTVWMGGHGPVQLVGIGVTVGVAVGGGGAAHPLAVHASQQLA
jgi:hypothetical protein